ncbi:MAG: molybdopterin-dependent oxidoreductase, partial [Rhodospirillaceae bacterium]|nr:molybdopterin-dependent oxidoreductase [Rhodospirillaceae bacterium]
MTRHVETTVQSAVRSAVKSTVKTTCAYCGVGCGILATTHTDGSVEFEGDPDHPANFGRLCSKGAALGDTLSLDDRLLQPMVDGRPSNWDGALDQVARRFADTIAAHGPDSVAFYVSGQLLNEDYYLANKLMKGFIGSANIDTNSRLCMASSVAGHKRAFGADTVPGCYEDLELADVIVLVGSNLAWCHPVLYQRIAAVRAQHGTKIAVIDPRQTATTEAADLHLPLAAGSDVALFNGLLAHLDKTGVLDHGYVDRYTSGFAAALATAQASSIDDIAANTGLTPAALQDFYDLFAGTERVITVYSQGVNQSTYGTDKVNAIINCHLATGRIGRPGMGPFSVTGQPNAMGGREVGGLANQLACHMDLENPEHHALVRTFWNAENLADRPGLKAVELFEAVRVGRIKALWIMATNPVDSLPEADTVRAALQACPFVVVSDVARHTDTTAHADVLLPAAAWGEKAGTVTNSERRISRQRAFLPKAGAVRPDWWIIQQVARRMGFADAFNFRHPAEIFAEYAELSGLDNGGKRDFDISAHEAISNEDYEGLQPFQWPMEKGSISCQTRFFADGQFFTPDRRARFIATTPAKPASAVSAEYPLVLNTGRIRDQWHTMTRTGKA